ncbi:MAG: dihydroorotate dehydrogenase electron transfer subunit [Brevinematales bacterium]|nr:dihydroorotate dehydrogenase electron transfer subunit [Brevinematales bacterium]
MKYEENAVLKERERQGEYVLLSLRAPQISRVAKPGQFVNVRVSETFDPLLRRPISIADVHGEDIRLLVQIRGKGSRLLAEKREGEKISLVGPLGSGFPLEKKDLLFVGGGVGVAPFMWLLRLFPLSSLVMGFRTASLVPPLAWFDEQRVEIATEDGSVGEKGTVLDVLSHKRLDDKVIFACGPHRMLSALAGFFEREYPTIEAYFSTESMMGCGFGACKGCVLPRKEGGYALCCTDGPVFFWRDMIWEK